MRRALLLAVTPFRSALPALVLLVTAQTAWAQFTPTVNVGGRQVTLSWSSPFPGATELAWGPTSAPSFPGYPNRFTAPGTGNAHSATLRRLAPGTWYVRARTASTESMEQQVIVPADGAPLADWAFDGPVNALLRVGSTWYVGGSFSSVGQTTGGGVPTQFDGGLFPQFPEVAGQVFAVEPDGQGGFYIGGAFTSVGGLPRSNVAHLLADLGVDPQWNLTCNGPVYTIQAHLTGAVYLGGGFTMVNGFSRSALVELSSGGQPTNWNPTANGVVFALERVGPTVYVGGNFSTVNSQTRTGLAAVDTTGTLLPWNPALTGGFVMGLMELGGVLYVHGVFNGIGGQSRAGLAALDVSGAVLPWNPLLVGGQVSAFAPNGMGSLFLGGSFTNIGGLSRPALALVDTDAGQPLPWNPQIGGGQVVGLTAEASSVYVVGDFTPNGQRVRGANFATATGTRLTWAPRFNGLPRAVGFSPSAVFVGGDFTGLPDSPRTALAAISATGALEAFAPTFSAPSFGPSVKALAPVGSSLVVGGSFSQVNGSLRNNVAMFSSSGLLNLVWNPNVAGDVSALGVTSTGVLIGGLFSQVNGLTPRANGAIVDPIAGLAVIGFNPGFNSSVVDIATEGATSYWVGGFGASNGVARGHAAGFTLPAGTLNAWNPFVTTEVKAVHVVGDKVVLGGSFNFVNSFIDRSSIAVFDRDGGGVTPFDARLVGEVRALASAGTTIYAGGSTLTDAGLVIVVDVNAATVSGVAVRGQTDPFLSTRIGGVETLAMDCPSQRLAVGGFFHSSGLTPVGGLTLIAAPCSVPGVDAGAVDAGVVDTDAGMGTVDAGSADAGVVDTDAGMGTIDAGAVDAGVVVTDAGMGTVDAGTVDAGVVVTDAGMGTVDAGVMSDAGSAMDAGVVPDAGAPTDGGSPADAGSPDGGVVVLDAGDGSDAGPDGGLRYDFVPISCGCSGVDQAPLGLGLLLALLLRRRSTR